MTIHETRQKSSTGALLVALVALGSFGCASVTTPYATSRDNTAKGAGIGAAAGAVGAVALGKREADEILAGAAIGALVGGGVGAYMDAQEEKIARIPGTTVERIDKETVLVHFESDVLFDVDSAQLDTAARSTLTDTAGVLQEFRRTAVVVQGHTDSTGTESHNLDLSEHRAEAVSGYFVRQGVDPVRLASVGLGEGYPVASNGSESGRRLNRRVDVMLRAKAQ